MEIVGCHRCTYGRRPDERCDVHGVATNSQMVCRSYREPGQSHGEAQKAYALLAKLQPGVVYSIIQNSAGRNLIRASFRVTPLLRNEPSPDVGDLLRESHEILVRNIDDATTPARIDCYESGLNVLLTTDVRYAGRDADNVFEALKQIRRDMEIDGRIPLINGANRHAVISGMAISMGLGYTIYLANPLTKEITSTVDTFGNDYVTDPVFVDEQEGFKDGFFNAVTE